MATSNGRIGARGAVLGACFGLGLTLLGGCIFFSNFDGLDSGTASGGGGIADSDGGQEASVVCTAFIDNLAAEIAKTDDRLAPVIDCDAADLCTQPIDTFVLTRDGRFRSFCEPAPGWLKEAGVTATIRSGWSEEGIHLFFAIKKNTDLGFSDAQPYHGDSLQIYLADPANTGGLLHTIIYPLDGGGFSEESPLRKGDVLLTQNDDGYTVEMLVHWDEFADAGFEAKVGQKILFDFILGTADPRYDPDDDAGNRFSASLCWNHQGTDSCKPDKAELVTMPTTWCTVKLVGER